MGELVTPARAGGFIAVSLSLDPDEVRGPHLHPNREEVAYCLSGRAQVGVVGPEGRTRYHDVRRGELTRVPPGCVHWLRNVGRERLAMLVLQPDGPTGTIELSAVLAALPAHLLAELLDLPESYVRLWMKGQSPMHAFPAAPGPEPASEGSEKT